MPQGVTALAENNCLSPFEPEMHFVACCVLLKGFHKHKQQFLQGRGHQRP